jgi:protoporphyrinogen/coproporphyrinogen III oxidase
VSRQRIAVLGGGIAGVAAAYQLASQPNADPVLFEASGRLGGTVETVTVPSTHGSFTVECGPDAWVSEKRAARELAEELGLGDELLYSNDATRRTYLARWPGGDTRTQAELVPMPDGMRMMVPTRWEPVLQSPLFSPATREAYQREPERADELRAHALPENTDESVASFVRRHFGEEATRTVAGPLLAGVFGGDVEKLSASAVLAPFVRMERERGSLVEAVMTRAREKGGEPEPIFTTVRPGLGELVRRMAARLPAGAVRLHTPVTQLHREESRWRVSVSASPAAAQGSASCDPAYEAAQTDAPAPPHDAELFDHVLIATPAHTTRTLLAPLDNEAAQLLPTHASSAVVVALLWEPPVALPLPAGFGFLVDPEAASGEEATLLAGTFMHQKWQHRAPEGSAFLRGFFGGAAAEQLQHAPEAEIVRAARLAFERILGPLPAHTHAVVRVWPRSLPQYEVGHPARTDALFQRLRQQPALQGLHLIGNSYRGVGLPDLIGGARNSARELLGDAR